MQSIAAILTALRAAVAAKAATDRALTALLVLVWRRLARIQTRLECLIAHWRAGTLPKPGPSRAGQPRKHAPKQKFPTARAWLAAHGYEIRGPASQLQHNLSDPEWAAFLAAAPQAGRLLRPLCRMRGIEPPASLKRDPKSRASRPKPPPKPKPELFRVPFPPGLRLPGMSLRAQRRHLSRA